LNEWNEVLNQQEFPANNMFIPGILPFVQDQK